MDKPLQIAFKNLESSEFLENMIRGHADHLERVYPHIIGCRVVVDVPHRSAETGKVPHQVAVEVEVPGRSMIVARDAQERHEVKHDQFAVVNRAFSAAERQLREANERQHRDVKHHEGVGQTGLVVRLFPDQEYGFIEAKESPDLYFTRNVVTGGSFDDLKVGTMVQFTEATTEGPMGPQASSVRILNATRGPS